jgi:hypothetical protein
MRIDSSGRVGIGAAPQTAPYYNNDNPVLTVHKASGSAILPIVAAANTSAAILHLNQSGNRYWRISALYGGALTFGGKQPGSGAAESEAMRIESNGDVILGNKTAINQTTTSGVEMRPTGTTFRSDFSVSNNEFMILNNFGSPAGTASMQFRYNSGVKGSIGLTSTAVSYNTSSDYRLKENVSYDWDATERLKQLKPARFNWISDDTDTLVDGFIAHEVTTIVPNAVEGIKDEVFDNDHELAGEPKYQQVDHSKLVPLLVKAVQEQQTIIDDLKSRIDEAGL